ncbi:MAG: hypothetical protein AB2L14_21715 [Candidatus Xenobiia bacterium LiM19]
MGYSHYWSPDRPIRKKYFKRVVLDFTKLLALEQKWLEPILRGPDGIGTPLVSDTRISFNGDRHCNHHFSHSILYHLPGKTERMIPHHGTYGPFIKESPIRACSSGRCSAQAMGLLSESDESAVFLWETYNASYTGSVTTNYKPYDIAVQCLLIIAKFCVPGFKVKSDGALEHWFNAMLLCQMNLGYGLAFRLGKHRKNSGM